MKYFKILLFLGIVSIWSCKKDDDEPHPDISTINLTSNFLYEIMDEFYLWYNSMPKDPDLSKDPYSLLEDLRYKSVDKWSYITSTEEYLAYFKEGKFTGYGFGFAPDEYGNMRISFVFDNSPLRSKGIKRGWIIKQVNSNIINAESNLYSILGGDEIKSHTFTFEDFEKNEHQYLFSKDTILINTVLLDTIYQENNIKTGYLVFKSFIEISENELIASFKKFKEANINELVVDLRYNGGGRADISLLLGGLIGGSKVKDQIMVEYIHNDKQTSENSSYEFTSHENSVELDRVFFITTKGSASASEMVINGLAPFIEVIQIGDDTHGKPAGMYVWPFKDLTVIPICFKIANAEGYGDYFDGLPVDAFIDDDITHDFGDTAEYCLREALYYIKQGKFSPDARLRSSRPALIYPEGIRFEIGAI